MVLNPFDVVLEIAVEFSFFACILVFGLLMLWAVAILQSLLGWGHSWVLNLEVLVLSLLHLKILPFSSFSSPGF